MASSSVGPIEKINGDFSAVSPVGSAERDESSSAAVKAGERQPIQVKAVEPRVQPVQTQDMRLRFVVDPQSKEVTVLLIDRTSHKVVRSIPSKDLNQLCEGNLVDLFD